MFTKICLSECIWDKKRATLTFPRKEENPSNTIAITSHVTKKVYEFKYPAIDGYKRDDFGPGSFGVWFFYPTDEKCPITRLYIIDGPWDSKTIYIEED